MCSSLQSQPNQLVPEAAGEEDSLFIVLHRMI
jgi:hypothetical protein